MLIPGRISVNAEETKTVEKLMAEHDGAAISMTRRDPGETGPLLLHVDDETWEISEDGKRKKVT